MLRFAPRIEVRVTREAFFFAKDGASFSLPTYLGLERTTKGLRVLSVGEPVPDDPSLVRVDLFGTPMPSNLPLDVGRMECLEAFMRFGIQKAVQRRTMVRPVITVTGLTNLESELHGYQATVLRAALEAAGAAEIHFPELR
jgi:hypothetical protein